MGLERRLYHCFIQQLLYFISGIICGLTEYLTPKHGKDSIIISKIYTAPDKVFLGRTLPSLLDEVCEHYPNSHAFNQYTENGWIPLSNQYFLTNCEYLASGLLEIGLEKGDRVFMHSDLDFGITDMGCLMAQMIDVPICLTQVPETIVFIMQHTEVKALIVSNMELLQLIAPYLSKVSNLKTVVVAKA